MNDEECTKVYGEIVAMLNEFKLDWVTEQVAEVIREGKTIEERSFNRKIPDLKVEDYSARDRLLLLVDAVEQAVVNTVEIEGEVASFMNHEAERLDMYPEATFHILDEGESKQFKFDLRSVAVRKKQAGELRDLLATLHKEVERSDR